MRKIFAFFAIQRYLSQFLNFGKIIVLSLNDYNTVNLRFLRLFFAMHQNLRHFLYRASENLRWPKVNFTTINLSRKIRKSRENRKTRGKVRCLINIECH
jgi:hypothetical protein